MKTNGIDLFDIDPETGALVPVMTLTPAPLDSSALKVTGNRLHMTDPETGALIPVVKLYEYPSSTAGVIPVPDYNNYTSIPALSAVNTEYTVEKTGYIQMYCRILSAAAGEVVDARVKTTDPTKARTLTTSGFSTAASQQIVMNDWFAFKKGDVIWYNYGGAGTVQSCGGWFVDPVLVAKELPVVVEKNGSYSLDEIKTADTWINGKPIYKKTFQGVVTVAANTWLTNYEVGSIGTFDTVVEIKGSLNRGNGQWSAIIKTDYNPDLSVKQCSDAPVLANGTVIWNSYMSIARTNSPYYITVYYTKTSD
jgi:hypothetical protein